VESETVRKRLMPASHCGRRSQRDGTTGGRRGCRFNLRGPPGLAQPGHGPHHLLRPGDGRISRSISGLSGLRAACGQAPRSARGQSAPMPDRPDPVAPRKEQATSRVPMLVPIRGRMLVSPFIF
jgi:hypothetical protein